MGTIFNNLELARFCSFAPSSLLWGEGDELFLFILSKTAIIDKINGTSGPPPISMMRKWCLFAPSRLRHCFGGGGLIVPFYFADD